MSHHSHLFTGKVSDVRELAIDAVLAPFDAVVVCIREGRSYRGWIASPNLGEPFDRHKIRRRPEMIGAVREQELEDVRSGRLKLLDVLRCNPNLDLRLVFMNASTRISRSPRSIT